MRHDPSLEEINFIITIYWTDAQQVRTLGPWDTTAHGFAQEAEGGIPFPKKSLMILSG